MSIELVEIRDGLAIADDWRLEHRHALGRAGEAFVEGLARGELIAARCPSCDRLLLPPRTFCERCFEPTELVPLEQNAGTLVTFTTVERPFAGSPPTPYTITYVQPDGCDTALGVLLDESAGPAWSDAGLEVGMRMELVIREQGAGIDRVRAVPAKP